MKKKETNKYYYAIGRRKKSISSLRLFEGKGESIFNGKPFKEIYGSLIDQNEVMLPIKKLGIEKDFYFHVKAKGGGIKGQIGATRLALARALVIYDHSFKKILKKDSFLTRDSRMVERKHTGKRKARKSEQYSKR